MSTPDTNLPSPARIEGMEEERFCLSDILREVLSEHKSGAYSMEKLQRETINQLFEMQREIEHRGS